MSIIVKAGKAAKRLLKASGILNEEHRVSYTRRIERIHTSKKICAMTFDDGPMNMPASPDRADGRAMTELILDALAKYSAHATFDIIGSTEENYPDKPGVLGSASWGGIRYDHYPDIECDRMGGAVNAPQIVERMLREGHELANHGYRHVIFGKKAFVYGGREHLGSIDEVIEDLERLHSYVLERFGYEMKLSRPPHYVDRLSNRLTSYDAYALMGYGYMAASYDGGGWLPGKSVDDEIDAMVRSIKEPLIDDENAFCGQIIFGKDGYNMAKRTPVAYALEKQLDLLYRYGYNVVSVSELLDESPFRDVGRECEIFDRLCELEKTRAIAYSDNTLRLNNIMTNYEYAMLICPKNVTVNERIERIKKTGKYISEYDCALEWAKINGAVAIQASGSDRLTSFCAHDGERRSADGFKRYDVLASVRLEEKEKITV